MLVGGKRSELLKTEREKNNDRPLQAIVIFPEILTSWFGLANAQTKALTDGITKMSLLKKIVTPYGKLRKFGNLSENRIDNHSAQITILL